MYPIIQTQAIVLNKYPSGDYDNFYVLFTKNFGKVEAFARSSRKLKAKLSAHLEPGTLTEVSFVPRVKQDNYLLVNAQSTWKPDFSKKIFSTNQLIAQTLFFAQKLTPDEVTVEETIKEIFDLLKEHLAQISSEKMQNNHLALAQLSFSLKLLEQAGFKPNLRQCLNCGQFFSREAKQSSQSFPKNSKIYYDKENGGLICENCFLQIQNQNLKQFQLIKDWNVLKLISFLMKEDFASIRKLKTNAALIKGVQEVVRAHLDYCLD